MKKVLAVLLSAVLVLSLAGCGSKAPESPAETAATKDDQQNTTVPSEETSSAEASTAAPPATEAPATEAPTTEAATEVDKQAFYEELFRTPDKIAYAGSSMKMTAESDGKLIETVYEMAGNDFMMGMFLADPEIGFSVGSVNGGVEMYISAEDKDGGREEHLYRLTEAVKDFEFPMEKPDFTFDEDDQFEIEYLGKEDGQDLVRARQLDVDALQDVYLLFNENAQIVRLYGESEADGRMDVSFYAAEKISMPGEGLETEEASAEEALGAMMLVLLMIMNGGSDMGDDDEGGLDRNANYILADEVLADDENCRVVITGCGLDEYGDEVEFFISLENKTEDKTLSFDIDEVIVNGYQISVGLYETLEAGESADESLEFSSWELKDSMLASVDELSFRLKIEEHTDWTTIFDQAYVLYPTGLSKEEIVIPERRTGENEQLLVDNEELEVILLDVTGSVEDGYWFEFYVHNKTDQAIGVRTDAFVISGTEIAVKRGEMVYPGARVYVSPFIFAQELKENSIEKTENIEFVLFGVSGSFWSDEKLFEENIVWTP